MFWYQVFFSHTIAGRQKKWCVQNLLQFVLSMSYIHTEVLKTKEMSLLPPHFESDDDRKKFSFFTFSHGGSMTAQYKSVTSFCHYNSSNVDPASF